MGLQFVFINSPLGTIAFKPTAEGWVAVGNEMEPWTLLDLLVAMSKPVQERAAELRAKEAPFRELANAWADGAKPADAKKLNAKADKLEEKAATLSGAEAAAAMEEVEFLREKATAKASKKDLEKSAELAAKADPYAEEHATLMDQWDADYNAVVAAHHQAMMATASTALMAQLGEAVTELVDTGYVAKLIGVSAATAANYSSRGLLPPPIKVAGRSPMWAKVQIDQWEDRRKASGTNADTAADGIKALGELVAA